MNKLIIYQYINKLTENDIERFSLNQGVKLNKDELSIIYNYIKNDYNRIINNPTKVISEIKDKVSIHAYNKILELYDKYKNFIDKLK